MKGIIPWSYSSLSAYEQCPRRFYLTRISKQVTEAQTESMLWGNRVHKALELALTGANPLEGGFLKYQPIVDRIMAMPGEKFAEKKVAVTEEHEPTRFFDSSVWFRGVLDVSVLDKTNAVILDYKTGKVKSDGDQLKLFAAAAFSLHPNVTKVTTGYIWLQHGKTTGTKFTRDDAAGIWSAFSPRVDRMIHSYEYDKWPPKPSGLCRQYCPVGNRLCEFCGE